jgi:polar amino acid transport system substrate-binding protein
MSNLRDIFYETLVVDNRWMLIVNGLWATVVITLLSLALGTLLGGGIYAMTRSRRSWVRKTAQYYRVIVRGTPLLVLLLFFFYVVLSGGNGILAAVIAFGINFSNLACTLFQSSIDTVGRDQIEAGRALGFTPMQNWRYIVRPQALKNALPAYKYQAVAMVKSTAIVGYVAVTDLALATESIRSATGRSFLPLLIITILYFILAWLLTKLLDYVAYKTSRI